MGCDIHLVMEYKMGDQFLPYTWDETSFVWRDYNVFNTLVGTVRPNPERAGAPIAGAPRGLPEDCHPQTRKLLEGEADHSLSWISWDEFVVHFPWTSPFKMPHFALVGYQFASEQYYDCERRFVFGFDN